MPEDSFAEMRAEMEKKTQMFEQILNNYDKQVCSLKHELEATKEKLESSQSKAEELEAENSRLKPKEEEKVIIELCHHVKEDGWRCGSPAVTDRRYCRYHLSTRGRRLKMARARARRERWLVELPPLESLYAVQVGLQQVLDVLASGQLDRQTARLMLSGLRQAASNLRLPEEVWDASDRFDNVGQTTWTKFEEAHGLPEGFDVDTPPDVAFPPAATSPAAVDLTGEEPASEDDLGMEDLLARDPGACKRRASELVRRYRRKLRYDEDKLERALALLAAAQGAAEAQKKEPARVTAEAGQPDTAVADTAEPGAAATGAGAKKAPQGEGVDTKDKRAEGAS